MHFLTVLKSKVVILYTGGEHVVYMAIILSFKIKTFKTDSHLTHHHLYFFV